MSINEYKELNEKEDSTSSLETLKAQKEFLKSQKQLLEKNKDESSSDSNENVIAHKLSNPSIPKFMISNNEDNGFSNIILLSIALILLGIIILIIVFI